MVARPRICTSVGTLELPVDIILKVSEITLTSGPWLEKKTYLSVKSDHLKELGSCGSANNLTIFNYLNSLEVSNTTG
jgi:hypothetical protein